MAEERGFLGRWSQRKAAVAKGEVLAEPLPQPRVEVPTATPLTGQKPPQEPVAAELTNPVELPPLTLDDVKLLTGDSDFAPFMSKGVAPDVKNAAMKKLFTDPHYNVMDGLDIYIDDYSKPDPLPESMLRQMVSAQFLKLFDDEKEDVAEAQPHGVEATTGASSLPTPGLTLGASPVTSDDFQPPPLLPTQSAAAPQTSPTPDDDPHLRLQPDHAPQPQSVGGGAA